MSYIESFPAGAVPRDSQKMILDKIEDAVQRGVKYVVVQAPTGSGKSHISATLANVSRHPDRRIVDLANEHALFKKEYGEGYAYEDELIGLPTFGCAVLTTTKALQNQYGNIFDDVRTLKGRRNYKCELDSDNDCDFAECTLDPRLLEECTRGNKCPFFNARCNALKNRFSVFNYASYLALPSFLQRRQFLVCDEASELEDELVKCYSCEIKYEELGITKNDTDVLFGTNRNAAFSWLSDRQADMKDKYDNAMEELREHKKDKRRSYQIVKKMRMYKQLADNLTQVLENWFLTEYVVECDHEKFRAAPLYVNNMASNFFKNADTVILMSGTIIDHQTFCATLGIKAGTYEYIDADTDFDPELSPIYCMSQYKLNFKNIDFHLPKIVTVAKGICDNYKDQKGIIHTHSFKITEAIQKEFAGDKRFLTREAGVTNEQILEMHRMSTESTVLISPSMGFGVDLADDHGRFSIIMKIPYLPLGDKRIKILSERNKRWYQMKALISLVQMCGRTTRNKEDHSDTYILDGCVVNLIKKNKAYLPKYFINRIR